MSVNSGRSPAAPAHASLTLGVTTIVVCAIGWSERTEQNRGVNAIPGNSER